MAITSWSAGPVWRKSSPQTPRVTHREELERAEPAPSRQMPAFLSAPLRPCRCVRTRPQALMGWEQAALKAPARCRASPTRGPGGWPVRLFSWASFLIHISSVQFGDQLWSPNLSSGSRSAWMPFFILQSASKHSAWVLCLVSFSH